MLMLDVSRRHCSADATTTDAGNETVTPTLTEVQTTERLTTALNLTVRAQSLHPIRE